MVNLDGVDYWILLLWRWLAEVLDSLRVITRILFWDVEENLSVSRENGILSVKQIWLHTKYSMRIDRFDILFIIRVVCLFLLMSRILISLILRSNLLNKVVHMVFKVHLVNAIWVKLV